MRGPEGKGGHTGPPLQEEPESIISFAVGRSIRLHPDQAAREMVKLIRENARLEGELSGLKEKMMALAYLVGVA